MIAIGSLINEAELRDAIHIAVAPVVANEILRVGQDIGFVGTDGKTVGGLNRDKCIGIVDPFLERTVLPQQRFWMFLYPNTITQLRHDWTHPAFAVKDNEQPTGPVAMSRAWIEAFAGKLDQTYNRLMSSAERWIESESDAYNGFGYTYDNTAIYKNYYEEFTVFWHHYEIVTGRKPKTAECFFTCSC